MARLRNVLRRAIDNHDEFGKIKEFRDNLKSTAKEQMHNTRLYQDHSIAGTRLDLWLDENLDNKKGFEKLRVTGDGDIPAVAGIRTTFTEELKTEYTLRLIEAVIDNAMKAKEA